ncbi:MAG: hypothetical protein NC090_06735 [Anaeroplasma bactoclasticum]|nr:hypothetical protein [Anaeroplasma bactoclasticum]
MKKFKEICKYIPLIIVIPFFVLSFIVCSSEAVIVNGVEKTIIKYYLQVDKSIDIPAADIIISLVPMIFTIITISLSLPAESILGVKNTTFRRARKDYHFRFIEMIVITIIIFVLFTIASIFAKTAIIWILDLVSIYYSFRFVFQEIPLLIQDEKYILKIVKKNWICNERDLTNGQLSKTSELQKIIKYIILNQGLKETYCSFRYKQKSKQKLNPKILDDLLSANNEFLFDCLEHKEYLSKNSLNSFNELDLQKSIDVSLDSLGDIFPFSDDFNICKIYGDADHFYQVTRMIFSLKKITDELSMNTIFEQKIGSCMRFLSYSSFTKDSMKDDFKSNFLKAMLKYSISENELWFIRLLRDSEFYGRFSFSENKPYLIFISIYFYYIINVDKTVPNNLKDDLYVFFNEPSKGFNSDGSNWYDVIEHQVEYSSFNDIANFLPELLKIYGTKDNFEPWYCPQYRHSWSSDEGVFDKTLIIRCWLELLVYNYHSFDFSEDSINNTIDNLEESDKRVLAYELSKNWFDNDKFVGIDMINSYLSLYKIRAIQRNEGCWKPLTNYLFKKKNLINLDDIKEDYNSDESIDFEHIKKTLIDGFNTKKKEIDVFDEGLPIASKKEYYYSLKIETYDYEQLVNHYINSLKDGFRKLIRQEFMKKVNTEVLTDVNRTMKNITRKYVYRSNGFYDLYNLECDNEIIKKVRNIKATNLWLPKLVFWKEEAIRFNIECDENKTFVRYLNPNEIGSIIDNEYKVTEGLYKFNNGDENKSVFVDRSQIYEIIAKKYFFVCIVFKYEVHFDNRKIKRFIINENDIGGN